LTVYRKVYFKFLVYTVNSTHIYKECIVMNITKAAKPMTIIIFFQNYKIDIFTDIKVFQED
jgi:hypothetical protein